MNQDYYPPQWAFDFHGHFCPFMPIGFRMGKLALEKLGISREMDHGFHVFTELGEGHPQTCMIDGIQASTGATFGKVLISKLFYGKLAATFYSPSKGAIRFILKPEFLDEMGKFEFFSYRKRGVEPSGIPEAVTNEVTQWISSLNDDQVFVVESKPDFTFTPIKGSFAKEKCSRCGEYVFERYLRVKDGKHLCIPCSGYEIK